MSRAFVKEDDGWAFCQEKMQSCMFSSERGACMLRKCKWEGAEEKELPEEQPAPKGKEGHNSSRY